MQEVRNKADMGGENAPGTDERMKMSMRADSLIQVFLKKNIKGSKSNRHRTPAVRMPPYVREDAGETPAVRMVGCEPILRLLLHCMCL